MPVLVADVKGDVSGLAAPGEPGGGAEKRAAELGLPFEPAAFPVEPLSLGGIGPGVPVRATVSDFGPQLLGKVLGANETQEQASQLVFHYADTKGLPLLDLADLRALLTFLDSDAGKAELEGIGGLSGATVGVLLRALVGLETGGGTEFFGEPQLDVADLLRVDARRRAASSRCVELPAVQESPRCGPPRSCGSWPSSSRRCPRRATCPSPSSSSSSTRRTCSSTTPPTAFLDADRADGAPHPLQGRRRLLRHPDAARTCRPTVLAQLGNRVQHALRAFTPEDAKALKATVSTFPKSDLLRPGGAAAALGDRRGGRHDARRRGVPDAGRAHAPARAARRAWRPPTTSSADGQGVAAVRPSTATRVDARVGARELAGRRGCRPRSRRSAGAAPSRRTSRRRSQPRGRRPRADRRAIGDFLTSRQGKTLQRQVIRGVFGMLRKRL